MVVCGQLGYQRRGVFLAVCIIFVIENGCSFFSGSVIRSSAYYGQGSGPVLYYFSCRGNEYSLYDCNKYFTTYSSCTHYEDVSVDCEGRRFVLINCLKILKFSFV